MAELIASYVLLQLHFIGYLSHLCEHEESVHKDKLTQISGHVSTIHVHIMQQLLPVPFLVLYLPRNVAALVRNGMSFHCVFGVDCQVRSIKLSLNANLLKFMDT